MAVQLLASINGGAPQSGGLDVPSAAVVQLSAASNVGWRQQRWEFYDYPEGWATPAGWTLAADGRIYSEAVTPDPVTLPANTVLWGPWALRLKIDEALDDDATKIAGLVDEATILHMASPKGQRMVSALEDAQFCTPTTLHKKWVRTLQRNLRILETLLGAGGPSIAIPAYEIDWSAGAVFYKTLDAGAQAFTFANATDGQIIVVEVTGAASTLTWPTVLWPGGTVPTQSSSGTDIYTFVKRGSNIFGSVVQAMG